MKKKENLVLSSSGVRTIEEIDISNPLEIKYLDLSNNAIDNTRGIDRFINLRYLNFSDNNLRRIGDLSLLQHLHNLSLNNNNISRMDGLSSLNSLVWLSLNDNELAKIENLENLKNLTYLYLENNKIVEITGLGKLKKLRVLDLRGNKINKLIGLEFAESLKDLRLTGNNLEIYDRFIYYTRDLGRITAYSRELTHGTFTEDIFNDRRLENKRKIQAWQDVLNTCDDYNLKKLGKFGENEMIKKIQTLYFNSDTIISIPLQKKKDNLKINVSIIQLQGLKGAEKKYPDRLSKFEHFAKSFWDENFFSKDHILVYNNEQRIRASKKIDELLSLSVRQKKQDLIVFPENTIPQNKIPELEKFSKNEDVMIIGGLEHVSTEKEGVFVNKAVVIDRGPAHFQEKQTPVLFEKDIGTPSEISITESIKCIKIPKIKIFETSLGRLTVMICKDFLRLSQDITNWIKKNYVEWIIIPSLTSKVLPFHHRLNRIFTYSKSNVKILYCNVGEYGGSELFHRSQMLRIEEDYQSWNRDNIGEIIVSRQVKINNEFLNPVNP